MRMLCHRPQQAQHLRHYPERSRLPARSAQTARPRRHLQVTTVLASCPITDSVVCSHLQCVFKSQTCCHTIPSCYVRVMLGLRRRLRQQTSGTSGGSPPGHGGSVAPPPAEQHFFQAADGQAAFLASLPARMLAAAAGGSLTDAPPRFAAKVVDMETVTQTAAMRRRYRTLSHVPLGGAESTKMDFKL